MGFENREIEKVETKKRRRRKKGEQEIRNYCHTIAVTRFTKKKGISESFTRIIFRKIIDSIVSCHPLTVIL